MITLRRSTDRKTTTMSSPNGKTPKVSNAFGLPSGKAYSCPGQTSICEKVCYAGKLEKIFTGFRNVMLENWDNVKDATRQELTDGISAMIDEFRKECDKKGAPKAFRIHHDGDFFSTDYACAWADVVIANPDIQFWAYTRSFTPALNIAYVLADIPNLTFYLSVDSDNEQYVAAILARFPSIKIAYLSQTADEAKSAVKELTGKVGGACPEVLGKIPLITNEGGACWSCQLCVIGKSDIRFSISGK
jgi:hypothetical protein